MLAGWLTRHRQPLLSERQCTCRALLAASQGDTPHHQYHRHHGTQVKHGLAVGDIGCACGGGPPQAAALPAPYRQAARPRRGLAWRCSEEEGAGITTCTCVRVLVRAYVPSCGVVMAVMWHGMAWGVAHGKQALLDSARPPPLRACCCSAAWLWACCLRPRRAVLRCAGAPPGDGADSALPLMYPIAESFRLSMQVSMQVASAHAGAGAGAGGVRVRAGEVPPHHAQCGLQAAVPICPSGAGCRPASAGRLHRAPSTALAPGQDSAGWQLRCAQRLSRHARCMHTHAV